MDKIRLRKVEREKASEESILLARQMEETEHIIQVSMVDKSILQMTFFKSEELRKGNVEPMFRIFFQKDDYINQDLSTEKTKWFTSSISRMSSHLYYKRYYKVNGQYEYEIETGVGCTSEGKRAIRAFLKEYEREDDECIPWQAVYRFQDSVLNKRLAEKHKKETDKIDAVMEQVKEVPENFKEWVRDTGMSDKRYLVYKPKKKQKADVFCSNCNERTEVDRKAVYLRNNHKTVCPMCNHKVIAKALGRMPCRISDEKNASLVQKTEEGFLLREFYVRRCLLRDGLQTEDFMMETNRIFYKAEDDMLSIAKSYEWANYKQTGERRWCEGPKYRYSKATLLYPDNLPEEWAHTPMKYSALEIMAQKEPTKEYCYGTGIYWYEEKCYGGTSIGNKIEHLIKMGLTNIAGSQLGKTYPINIEYNQKSIFDALKLDKERTRILQSINGNEDHLKLLQVAKEKDIRINAEELIEFYEMFGRNTRLLSEKRKNMSMKKFMRYFEEEAKEYKANMARDWVDYISWCRELGYNLKDDYYYMPKNFKTAHNNVMNEYTALQDRRRAEQQRIVAENARKQMEATMVALQKILPEGMYKSGKKFAILIPHNADEIKEEGKSLHHCVGTYISRVAAGETTILFVRKQEELQTPYFTMEYRNGHIVQCRGSHNCDMPKELQAFTVAFEKKMQEVVLNKLNNR